MIHRPSIWVCARSLPTMLGCILALILLSESNSHGQIKQFGAGKTRGKKIILLPRQGVDLENLHARHRAKGHRLHRKFDHLGGLEVVQLSDQEDLASALDRYQKSGLVQFAEPDYVLHATDVPNDPFFLDGTMWSLRNTGQNGGVSGADLDAISGWDSNHSAANIIVAVIDSGVRYTHEDLAANMWVNPGEMAGNGLDDDKDGIPDDVHGFNALNGTGDPRDDNGHGTHVAGVLGAVGNNGKGVCGVAWNIQIMALKFLDAQGDGDTSDAISCIDYARKHGAKLINASWGGDTFSFGLQTALVNARNAGMIFVNAAGNEHANNDTVLTYPVAYTLDNIVVVTSTTRFDSFDNSYANYGATNVDLAAPGTAIYSTWHSSDNAYAYSSGSSMSAPFVTGALALMMARFPDESYRQLIARLLASTDPLPSLTGRCVTGGRLNLQKALGAALIADFEATPIAGNVPLSVNFTNLSAGETLAQVWNFGDGSAPSLARNPSHTYTREGNFTATLTLTGLNGLTAAKSRTISVVANYAISSPAYNWIDPTNLSTVTLNLSDDGVSTAQQLPFNFNYYGQVYNRIFVGANGLLGFSSSGLQTFSNADLPGTATPNAIICPYWDNFYGPSGRITVGTTGSAPNRQFVVTWSRIPRTSSLSIPYTFQAILNEDGSILFQYQEVHPESQRGAGRRGTVGLENETGRVAAKYLFEGAPTVLKNEQAILFTPTGGSGLEVLPNSTWDVAGSQGGPFLPSSKTYSLLNTGNTPLRWAIGWTQPWIVASITNGVLSGRSSVDVVFNLGPEINSILPGSYSDTISFTNLDNGVGNTTRDFTLSVSGTNSLLELSPPQGLASSGPAGGPFSPHVQIYTLINTGDASLPWEASTDHPWCVLSETNGVLQPGEVSQVVLSVEAGNLPQGFYTATVTVKNRDRSDQVLTRTVTLTVNDELRLVLLPGAALIDFGFSLNGLPSTSYVVEASTNLFDWSVISTNSTSSIGRFELRDSAARTFERRFYRAKPAP